MANVLRRRSHTPAIILIRLVVRFDPEVSTIFGNRSCFFAVYSK